MSVEYKIDRPHIKYRLRFENDFGTCRWYYEYCYPSYTLNVNHQGTNLRTALPTALVSEFDTLPNLVNRINELIMLINQLKQHDHGTSITENWTVLDSDEDFIKLTERAFSKESGKAMKFIMEVESK